MQYLLKFLLLFLVSSLVACGGGGGGGSNNAVTFDPETEGNTSSEPPVIPDPAIAERLTVVVAVIDSMMPEDFDINPAAMPAVQELVANGTYYKESRSVFSAETIPNHVAMMTGVYPDRNGIPTNNFWDKIVQPDNPEDVDLSKPKEMVANTLFTWIDQQCRVGSSPRNADIRTASIMSKKYLYEVFEGDESDDLEDGTVVPNDAGIVNVRPDIHINPAEDENGAPQPGYIDQGSEHRLDSFTGPEAIAALPNADFMFINLGDLDRSAHAAGESARNASRTTADQQIGDIIQALKDAGRWENTVFILVSDHGMDFSDPTASPPGPGDLQFDESLVNNLLNSVSTQPLLDALASEDCGFSPMFAAQNGGSDSIYLTDLNASATEGQRALQAARICLLDRDGDACKTLAGVDVNAVIEQPTACYTAVSGAATGDLSQIEYAWYVNPDLYTSAGNLAGLLATEPEEAKTPASIKSRHENLGDLVLAMKAGSKFSEPGPEGNPIPGNHGHISTIHNIMIVSGGVSFLMPNQEVSGTSDDHMVRDPIQSENVDVAATVAWLLGLNISDNQFPDANKSLPNYGDDFERKGFDGRVLSEAFSITEIPSNCGLLP